MMSRRERNYKGKRKIVTFGQFVLPLAVIMALALMFFSVKLFFFNPTSAQHAVPVPEPESVSHETVTKENSNTAAETKSTMQKDISTGVKHVSIKSAVPVAAEKKATNKVEIKPKAPKTTTRSDDKNSQTAKAEKAVPAASVIKTGKTELVSKSQKRNEETLKKNDAANLHVTHVKPDNLKKNEAKKRKISNNKIGNMATSDDKSRPKTIEDNKTLKSAENKIKRDQPEKSKKDKQPAHEKKLVKLPVAKVKTDTEGRTAKNNSDKNKITISEDKTVKKTSGIDNNKDKHKQGTSYNRDTDKQKQTQKTQTAKRAGSTWDVQIGGFSDKKNSTQLLQKANSDGYQAYISESEKDGAPFYRIRVRGAKDKAAAQKMSAELQSRGYPVFLVKTQ